MNSYVEAEPVRVKLITPGVKVLLALMAVAGVAVVIRFMYGLAAVTNLTDEYPWGIWKALNVATGVALAGGGFTTAALAHIFHRKQYEVVVRPALLVAMLGYTFGCLALLVDLGRYYAFYHPLLPSMWQGNSVLFEVSMCIMFYLTVMYIEFTPIICERFRGRVALPGPLAVLNQPVEWLLGAADAVLDRVMFLFILGGVVLSCMHQSSLGALMLIADEKVHPLWYTPVLPLLFLMSNISVGYPMVIVESVWSAKTFGRRPRMDVLTPLSRFVIFLWGAYVLAKILDLLIRDAYRYLFAGDVAATMFVVEMVFAIVPLGMLISSRVRRSPNLLLTACAMIGIDVAINRVNVFLVAYHPPGATSYYFPSLAEVVITVGMFAALIFVYRVAVMVFPILPSQPGPSLREHRHAHP